MVCSESSKIIHQLVKSSLDFHCHGIGPFDFTELTELDLDQVERILSEKQQQVILTLYLTQAFFDDFLKLMENYHAGRKEGKYSHIIGIGLEGPLLASHGGTPQKSVWSPSKSQWELIANCGPKGLVYIVLSPDAYLPGSNFYHKNSESITITWISETLLEKGVLLAPGHFTKNNPLESAKALQSVFDVVAVWGRGAIITDHLFNDMPHNFKHAWRTPDEKKRRQEEIKGLHLEKWNLQDIDTQLGPIPAVIIKNALKGLVKICQNFDGEHVDFVIIKKVIDMIGAENMLMMTDSIESQRLAGRPLHRLESSSLLYQDEGIVAAGTQNSMQQIQNMLDMGLTLQQIKQITCKVPFQIIKNRDKYFAQRHNLSIPPSTDWLYPTSTDLRSQTNPNSRPTNL